MSEKYVFLVILSSLGSMRQVKQSYVHYAIGQGKVELQVYLKTHISVSSPLQCVSKQLCALAHLGCTCKAGTF